MLICYQEIFTNSFYNLENKITFHYNRIISLLLLKKASSEFDMIIIH